MSLLIVENLTKEYGHNTILDNISFRIHKGERVILVGSNGCGKSTLLKTIMGIETQEIGAVRISKGTKVGYLSQDLKELSSGENLTALEWKKVLVLENQIKQAEKKMIENPTEEVLRKYSNLIERYEKMDGYIIKARIKEALMGLGLKEEAFLVPVADLSGGEKMRVALARILIEKPDILILDEPTNHLDISAVEWLEKYLCSFEGGVLVVSHDRYFMDKIANKTINLSNSKITERKGNYSEFIKQKKIQGEYLENRQERLGKEIDRLEEMAQRLKGMRKISSANSKLKVARKLEKELDEFKNEALSIGKESNVNISFVNLSHKSTEIAIAKKLTKRFGEKVLFENIDFSICGGDRIGIVGANGCGKTTLLNMMVEKDKDYEGTVFIGSWVSFAYLGQNLEFKNEERTVIEEVMEESDLKKSEAISYIARFSFYGLDLDKQIKVLSGGEKARLTLSCIMLSQPQCLLLDEPTNHLDVDTREELEDALEKYNGTIVAVSHDRYFLKKITQKIFEIWDGELKVFEGGYEQYRDETKERIAPEEQIKKDIREKKKKKREKIKTNKRNEIEKKKDIKNIENEIMLKEDELRALEESFGPDTPIEKYNKYNLLKKSIDILYDMWENM